MAAGERMRRRVHRRRSGRRIWRRAWHPRRRGADDPAPISLFGQPNRRRTSSATAALQHAAADTAARARHTGDGAMLKGDVYLRSTTWRRPGGAARSLLRRRIGSDRWAVFTPACRGDMGAAPGPRAEPLLPRPARPGQMHVVARRAARRRVGGSPARDLFQASLCIVSDTHSTPAGRRVIGAAEV